MGRLGVDAEERRTVEIDLNDGKGTMFGVGLKYYIMPSSVTN